MNPTLPGEVVKGGVPSMLNRLFGNQPAIPEIDVQTFATERAAKEKIQIVDVRELDEWNASGRRGLPERQS